jgi:hypothetical protein
MSAVCTLARGVPVQERSTGTPQIRSGVLVGRDSSVDRAVGRMSNP